MSELACRKRAVFGTSVQQPEYRAFNSMTKKLDPQ